MDFKKSCVCGLLTMVFAALVASKPITTEELQPTTMTVRLPSDRDSSIPTISPSTMKTSVGLLKIVSTTTATRNPTRDSYTSTSVDVLKTLVSPTSSKTTSKPQTQEMEEEMSDINPQEIVESSAEPHTTAKRSVGTQAQILRLTVQLLGLSKNTWDAFSNIVTKLNASLTMSDFLSDAYSMDRPRFSADVIRDITTCSNKQVVLDAGRTLMVNYLPWILHLTSVDMNDSVAMYLNSVIDAFDALTPPTGAPASFSGQLPSTTAPPPRDTPSVLVTLSSLHQHCGTLAEFMGRCILTK